MHILAAVVIPGWQEFQDLIFYALKYLQTLTGDWGMAIILLTVAMRVLILPLTVKQTSSMYELQRIQPKIKELQEKYKDDKEKLQEETLKFYQENKVNPFGGCLPLLLQMPIFFALFSVLRYRLPQSASFYGIIPNLSLAPKQAFMAAAGYGPTAKLSIGSLATPQFWSSFPAGLAGSWPYLLLVALFAVSIWLPQALMPGDKQQKMIGGYMAIVMLFFGWASPAGVLLYWDVSSVWGVAQQQATMVWMNRKKEADALAESEAVAEKPESKQPAKKQSGGKKKR